MTFKIFITLVLSFTAQFALAGNYSLTVDGKAYEITLGEEKKIKIDGQLVSVKVEQKDILTYETDNFSFQHSNKYAPSQSDLGGGVIQTAMMTPLGSVVLVQEYNNLDPSGIIDMMINEVTKEEREYGYKIESTPSSTTLSDGKKLTGKIITSKYKGSDIKRHFYTYGIKDSGLFVMTQIDYAIATSNDEFIKLFLQSLQIKMK